ncbi:MAG: hypothetical protein BGO09_13565 [Bacteroidetes bacterium 47-18]|nr:MAG: hypothetical protein BGO09_13565 [Bacteroidetes bacterium 47-18]
MKNKKVYEYAILRIVPDVAKEEFINAGVILYSRHLRFIGIKTLVQADKLRALDPDIDLQLVSDYIKGIEQTAAGNAGQGGIAALEPHERFRWLTANRSTILQCSPIHTGLTDNAQETLRSLFEKYTG